MVGLYDLEPAQPVSSYMAGKQEGQRYRLAEQAANIAQRRESRDEAMSQANLGLKTLESQLRQKEFGLKNIESQQKQRKFAKDILVDIGMAATHAASGRTPQERQALWDKNRSFFVNSGLIPQEVADQFSSAEDLPTLAALADPRQQEAVLQKMKQKEALPKGKGLYEVEGYDEPIYLREAPGGRLIDAEDKDVTGLVKEKSASKQEIKNIPADIERPPGLNDEQFETYRFINDPKKRDDYLVSIKGEKAAEKHEKKELLRKQKIQQADAVAKNIDKALENIGILTTGPIGTVTSKLGFLPRKDLESAVTTIKSNEFVNSLKEMRESSPTGGAVGNVSNVEGEKLQSRIANLNLDQSTESLKEGLKQIGENYLRLKGLATGEIKVPKDQAELDSYPSGTLVMDENSLKLFRKP